MPVKTSPRAVAIACLDCSTPTFAPESRCETCQAERLKTRKPPKRTAPRLSADRRGYDAAWRELSQQARALQPFCSDCGATDDLTGEHSEQAWRRKAQGKPIRLQDIDVLCRSCNSKRGALRHDMKFGRIQLKSDQGVKGHGSSCDPAASIAVDRLSPRTLRRTR